MLASASFSMTPTWDAWTSRVLLDWNISSSKWLILKSSSNHGKWMGIIVCVNWMRVSMRVNGQIQRFKQDYKIAVICVITMTFVQSQHSGANENIHGTPYFEPEWCFDFQLWNFSMMIFQNARFTLQQDWSNPAFLTWPINPAERLLFRPRIVVSFIFLTKNMFK